MTERGDEYIPTATHKVTIITREWLVPSPSWSVLVAHHEPNEEVNCDWLELLLPNATEPGNPLVVPIKSIDNHSKLLSEEDGVIANDPDSLLKQIAQKRNIQLSEDWTVDRAFLIWDQSLASREWEYMHEQTCQILKTKFDALKCRWIRIDDDKTIEWSLVVNKV